MVVSQRQSDLLLSDERASKRNYFPFSSSYAVTDFSSFCFCQSAKCPKFGVKRSLGKENGQRRRRAQRANRIFPFLLCPANVSRREKKMISFSEISRHRLTIEWAVELRKSAGYKHSSRGPGRIEWHFDSFLCEQNVTSGRRRSRSIDCRQQLTTNKAVKTSDLWAFVWNFTFVARKKIAHRIQ